MRWRWSDETDVHVAVREHYIAQVEKQAAEIKHLRAELRFFMYEDEFKSNLLRKIYAKEEAIKREAKEGKAE